MFQYKCVAFALFIALGVGQSGVAWSQDAAAGEQQVQGFKLKPTAIVPEPIDEGSLTEKVSFFIGYNLMKDLKRQKGKDLNMGQIFEGMKAASEGADKGNFVTGYQLMSNLKRQGADLEVEKIFAGMNSASEGKDLAMSKEEVQAMMASFTKLVENKKTEKMKKLSDENIAAGKAYMEKNAAENPNVKMLENGVQYEILIEGDGPIPTAEDVVKVDYHGMFLDGEVFDSSIDPPSGRDPKPAQQVAGGFVPGFSKVLQSMKVGGKWRVVIPGKEAYKMAGVGPIGPNQALIFEVTLLEIVK